MCQNDQSHLNNFPDSRFTIRFKIICCNVFEMCLTKYTYLRWIHFSLHIISVLSNDYYFQINGPYWKRHSFEKLSLVVIYAKILHHSFIPIISKNFISACYIFRVNENLETSISILFVQLKELKLLGSTFTG